AGNLPGDRCDLHCVASQAVRRSAKPPKKLEIGPEMPALCAFDLVSRLPIRQSRGAYCRKSPAATANIPVFRRLPVETRCDHDCRPTLPSVRIPLGPPAWPQPLILCARLSTISPILAAISVGIRQRGYLANLNWAIGTA